MKENTENNLKVSEIKDLNNPYDFEIMEDADRGLISQIFMFHVFIRPYIIDLVEKQYPIHIKYIYKHVAQILFMPRITVNIKSDIDYIVKKKCSHIGEFIFPYKNAPIRAYANNSRRIDYISHLEIAEAMFKILKVSDCINQDELFKLTRSAYNLKTFTDKVSQNFNMALKSLLKHGKIYIEQDKICSNVQY